jgi:hypothetical protein
MDKAARPAAALVVCLAVAAGCAPRGVVPALALLDGYCGASDPCRTVARTAYTRRLHDAGGTLVACPEDMPRLERFAAQTGALAVDRVGGYVLYRVGGPPLGPS